MVRRRITEHEVAQKIDPHTLQYLPLRENNAVGTVKPDLLLTAKRFDLLAKYIYAQYRELALDTDWAIRLYDEHIRVFNNYTEGNGTKCGIDDFVETFDSILDATREKGFDEGLSLVPVGNDHVIIDGAHRVSACLAYQKPITCLFVDKDANVYDYQYFLRKGLGVKWADAMALEYCRLKKNTYIVTVFPSAVGRDERVRAILRDHGDICYEKPIYLRDHGPLNLIRQMYVHEEWLGNWHNNFRGAREKARACFRQSGPLKVFVFEADDLSLVRQAKEEIRALFDIGNHSVHINDSHEETIRLAQILLNANSIHFLNYAKPTHYKWFYHLLNIYKRRLDDQEVDKDLFCIDGSAVMAIYGIREARDLDFLHCGDDSVSNVHHAIDSHNSEIHHYTTSRDDIIFNPENHFYYDGLKFASLQVIRDMKKKRGEPKDVVDVELMEPFIESFDMSRMSDLRQSSHFDELYWKERVKNLIPSPLLPIAKAIKRGLSKFM